MRKHSLGESSSRTLSFNRSVSVTADDGALSSNGGVVVLRELADKFGNIRSLARTLRDDRRPDAIEHSVEELLRASIFLPALGWGDQDDADHLRNDKVLRIALSDHRGAGVLDRVLPSQPTLSRFQRLLSEDDNRTALRASLLDGVIRRRQSQRIDAPKLAVIDVDSFPVEVHGHQHGSAYNGHYHVDMYHPLLIAMGDTGEIVDARLRGGTVHTADGVLDDLLPLLERIENGVLCDKAIVRMDAGFPVENTLAALEKRETKYVARVRNNAVLDKLAAPLAKRPVGRPPETPRLWTHELKYKAGTWSHERRVVLVVQEVFGELFARHFWLVTNFTDEEMPGDTLLELYRQRGQAEARFGDFMSTLSPALSSTIRLRSKKPKRREQKQQRDPRKTNEVILLLHMLAANLMHAIRILVDDESVGSLRRVGERVLRIAARVVTSARRIKMTFDGIANHLWGKLTARLRDAAAVAN
jgi:Transposase DDE domain group 1